MVRLTDHPNMTLDVYRGRNTTQLQQQIIIQFFGIITFLLQYAKPHFFSSGHFLFFFVWIICLDCTAIDTDLNNSVHCYKEAWFSCTCRHVNSPVLSMQTAKVLTRLLDVGTGLNLTSYPETTNETDKNKHG